MMFRNTIRLSMSNFSSVWKLLLYYLICTALSFAILFLVARPIIEKLIAADVFTNFFNMLNSVFSNPGGFAVDARQLLTLIWQVLTVNSSGLVFNYVLIVFMFIVFMPFIYGLADLALGEVLYGYMSSQTKYGFSASFLKKLGKSCLLQLVKILLLLPLNIIVVASFIGTINVFATGGIGPVFAGLILVLIIVLILSVKETLFCCLMPAMLVQDLGPFKALKVAIKASFRNFWNIFSTALSLVLIMIAINIFLSVFTFSIALIITLPLTIFIFKIFDMVSYFTCQGMRFYVYPDQVITPKKMEEQDSTKRLKYLI